MNHRSKIGYTVFGAVIMLFGITVGSIVSPPLVAPRDGSFDEVRCATLTVVGEGGQVAIRLSALKNEVIIYDAKGEPAIRLAALGTSNSVMVHDSDERKGSIAIADNQGNYAVHLAADAARNRVIVYDTSGRPALGLYADGYGNNVLIYDKEHKVRWRSP